MFHFPLTDAETQLHSDGTKMSVSLSGLVRGLEGTHSNLMKLYQKTILVIVTVWVIFFY